MVYAKKIHRLIPLGFILALALFLKVPSLFEPYHYGDEGIYQVVGQVIRRGGLLYHDAWDNKPPLLYLLYSIFDGDQLSLRLLSLIFCLLTIFIFYLLTQEVFPKRKKIAFFTTLLFALLFSLPLLEGNIANAENFMLLPIILAFYLVVKNFPKTTVFLLWTSGSLLSLAFLFKIVAVFDFGALFLFLTIGLWGKTQKMIHSAALLCLGFILPIAFTALIFLSQGVLKEFLSATFSTNVGYVAWENKLIIPQGWLILKLTLLFLFCLFLFWQRKKLEKGPLLIFLWFALSLFNAFFAGRPWTHYLLVLAPSFCLLFGLSLESKRFRILTIFLLLLTLYLADKKFWLYKQTPQYYSNFFSLILNQKTLDDYRSFWGGHVNRDLRVAQFLTLKTTPDEPVFVWGNNAQVYALAKRRPASRYTVAYHMGFSPQAEKETLQDLVKNKPGYFIILLPQTDSLKNLQPVLAKNYNLFFEEEGYAVYKRQF